MPGAKILVIDDESDIRQFFQTLLTRLEYEAITAEDGVAGLEAFYAHLPDLVIVDVFMPRKDGLEVIREIRSLYPDQKIVAMAAIGGEPLIQAREAGANDVLPKPFGVQELKDKISAWL